MAINKLNALSEIKESMAVELLGVNSLLENIESLIPVIEKFDGKVVNKRLYDALKATGKMLYSSEWLGKETVTLRTDVSYKSMKNHTIYPSYHREGTFDLVKDGKRLIASETIASLTALIERLENAKVKYNFNESAILAKFEELERLENEIAELFSGDDYITKEVMRKQAFHIR